ncbi:MAG: peptide deformylase [Planctomycetes bacterium]|nr:peptide deformylase [Planctomycetota bacterium]
MRLRVYPDPVLRQRCRPVEVVDDRVQSCIDRMFELMYEHQGIGLAAPQAGWDARVFVINVIGSEEEPDGQMAFVNPQVELIDRDERDSFEEGCLSLPGIRIAVERPMKVRVQALDREGNSFTLEAEDLFGRCIQHENDHLDGILIPSRVSTLRRMAVRGKLRELEEEWDPNS